MGIKLNCPTCGKDYDVHPALAGQPLACSDCGVSFTVPAPSAPSESSDKKVEVVIEESGARCLNVNSQKSNIIQQR